MTELFDASERLEHRLFWADRASQLRAAAIPICAKLKIADSVLHHWVHKLTDIDTPVARTIGSFLKREGSLSHKPHTITALCCVLADLCAEHAEDLDAFGPEVAVIASLREATRKQFPEFPPERRRPASASSGLDAETLRRIIDAIPSSRAEDDVHHPEFPPHSPGFPSTLARTIKLREREIIVKDESSNPTGSHKDRWAWEQLLLHKQRIAEALARHKDRRGPVQIPQLSMISSGSAAFALQSLLRLRGLPPLRVLIDSGRTKPGVLKLLRAVGAIIYEHDLDAADLDDTQVLAHTQNPHGIDITTRDVATPGRHCFYDWLVCEILLEQPNYIFVPYGTGDLFTNIISILEQQAKARVGDQRLTRVPKKLQRGIHVLGAIPSEDQTRMDKLYAKYRPTKKQVEAKVAGLIKEKFPGDKHGILGRHSGIFEIADHHADEALELAHQQGFRTELSGIAGLALYLERRHHISIKTSDRVLVVNTGWLYLPD